VSVHSRHGYRAQSCGYSCGGRFAENPRPEARTRRAVRILVKNTQIAAASSWRRGQIGPTQCPPLKCSNGSLLACRSVQQRIALLRETPRARLSDCDSGISVRCGDEPSDASLNRRIFDGGGDSLDAARVKNSRHDILGCRSAVKHTRQWLWPPPASSLR
jgi:hypothetical protein